VAKLQTNPLIDEFERALDIILARVSVSTAAATRSIAIAYSGGLDSAALLHLAQAYASTRGITLLAFHIHHGISPNADDWLLHCERECARLGIPIDARRVTLDGIDRHGLEKAARLSRYAALGELCRAYRVPLLLTAHHQDDQAETVLLQLLRGSGMAGLSGMEGANMAPDLLGDPELVVGRPLLDVSRRVLERFVAQEAIRYVEDESNLDARYARNALRHNVMPLFAQYFPGFQERFSRTARHAQAAQRVLNDSASQDLAGCLIDDSIDIGCLSQLSQDRINNLFRYWFARQGLRMPTTAWLDEMREQLLTAKDDAQVRVMHADGAIRRYRGRIFLISRSNDVTPGTQPLTFRWHGEARIDFAPFGGSLHFDETEQGLDAEWLRGQSLQVGHRSGGEKLKPTPNRPTKSLKHHYQALGIPTWERLQLPVIMANGKLLFAAGVGMNWRAMPPSYGPCVCLRWEKTSP
jgi:tRNA(Ile)-lysidine synthase